MHRLSLPLILLIVLFGTAELFTQNSPSSIKLDVPLVSVDVTVIDSQGKSITNLTRYDFDVLEDGVVLPITNFTPVSTPYNVLVLIDCSDSTRDRMALLLGSMVRFLDQLRPGDKVAIAAFGDEVHLILDWDMDKKGKISFVENPICRNTDFYGAINWSVKKLRQVSGRRGVVVFSDGFQTDVSRKEVVVNGNKVSRVVPPEEDHKFQNVLKNAGESGAPFYFVAVDTDINPGRDFAGPIPDLQQIRIRMEQLASKTGGRIAFPKETNEVVPLFIQIGRELGSSYSLAYTPPRAKDGKYHTIDVRVRGQNYQVQQSRKGYIAN